MTQPISHIREGSSEPAVQIAPSPINGVDRLAKDTLDFAFALIMIIFCAPLLLAVAILIRLDSPGPVMFTQFRYGEGGRTFRIFKFRTLYVADQDLSGAQQVAKQDPRVTRIGHFLRASCIDELPQLFNVLLGDLSLVGPRPHPIGMRTEGRLGVAISPRYMERYRVKPGMTGLAQVRGHRGPLKRAEELEARVASDLEYIENWTLLGDVKILLKTPICILTQSGHL